MDFLLSVCLEWLVIQNKLPGTLVSRASCVKGFAHSKAEDSFTEHFFSPWLLVWPPFLWFVLLEDRLFSNSR